MVVQVRLRQIDSVFPVILSSENLATKHIKKTTPEKKKTKKHVLPNFVFFPGKLGENLANLWRETHNQFGAALGCSPGNGGIRERSKFAGGWRLAGFQKLYALKFRPLLAGTQITPPPSTSLHSNFDRPYRSISQMFVPPLKLCIQIFPPLMEAYYY